MHLALRILLDLLLGVSAVALILWMNGAAEIVLDDLMRWKE
jgi:hypothetical protein